MPHPTDLPSTQEIDVFLSLLRPNPRAAIAFVGDKAAAQDMPWLYALLQAGWFDAPHLSNSGLNDASAHNPLEDFSVSTIAALSAIHEGINYEIDTPAIDALAITVSPEFAPFLQAVATQFFETFQVGLDAQASNGQTSVSQTHGMHNQFVRLATAQVLLQLACMTDHAEVARLVLKECPDALRSFTLSKLWGDAADRLGTPDVQASVTLHAALTAIAFSSHQALAVLEAQGLDLNQPLARYPSGKKIKVRGDLRKKKGANEALLSDVIDLNVLQCTPRMLKNLLDKGLAPGGFFNELDQEVMYPWAERLLDFAKHGELQRAWVAVCLEKGLYDLHPEQSIRAAAAGGNIHVVAHFQDRMPWAALLDGAEKPTLLEILSRGVEDGFEVGHFTPTGASLSATEEDLGQGIFEPLLLQVIEWAVRDGHGEHVFAPAVLQQADLIRPLIENYRDLALKCYLDHGLDPDTVLDTGQTVLALAEELGNDEAVGMMLSMQARRRALSTMSDMQGDMVLGKSNL